MSTLKGISVNFETEAYDVKIPCKTISKDANISLTYADGSNVVSRSLRFFIS